MATRLAGDRPPLTDPVFRPVEQPEKPPFDFRADLLLLAGLVPAAPIREAFPRAGLLAVGGRVPLLAWFSRVRESCYRDAAGSSRCTDVEDEGAYAELTLLLVRRDGSFFGPHIAASSALSQRLARAYYGMPKVLAPADFGPEGDDIVARMGGSYARARPLRGGAIPATPAVLALAHGRTWRAWFPGGGSARGQVPWVDQAIPMRVREAVLAPHAPWLPGPARPLPVGLLLKGARMRLLPP